MALINYICQAETAADPALSEVQGPHYGYQAGSLSVSLLEDF